MERVDKRDLSRRIALIGEMAARFAEKGSSTLPEFLAFEKEYRETGEIMRQLAAELDADGRHRDAAQVREALRRRPRIAGLSPPVKERTH